MAGILMIVTAQRKSRALLLRRAGSMVLILLTFAADTLVLLEVSRGAITLGLAGLLHLALLAASGLAIASVRPPDFTPYLLSLSFAIVTGPAGLVLGLALSGIARVSHDRQRIVGRWKSWATQDITNDGSIQLAERIESGRALRPSRPERGLLAEIMKGGNFAEKQWLLGVVAQKYHTDFRPTLEQALRDTEPGLRVQAAAIRARLSDRVALELRHLLEIASADPDDAATASAEADRMIDCLRSTLLDPSEARRLRAAAISYCQNALAAFGSPPTLKEQLIQLHWDGRHYHAAFADSSYDDALRPA
jgi:hypothetical protein